MCGIVGVFGEADASRKVLGGMAVLAGRGRDGYGLTGGAGVSFADDLDSLKPISGTSCIGHCLHNIVDFVPQPRKGDKGILTANCEIYNWQALAEELGIEAKNDADVLLHLIEEKGVDDIAAVLDRLDGVYSFAYWEGDTVVLARDVIGVKPLWYSLDSGLAFASEAKALRKMGYTDVREPDPRRILVYDTQQQTTTFIERPFFETKPEHEDSYDAIETRTEELLLTAFKKRLPEQKFGILLSGGVDSTFLALMAKKLGCDFVCYTSALVEEGLKESEDLHYAQKISKQYGFPFRVKKQSLSDVDAKVPQLVELIEEANVVKIGVALTIANACELAQEDGVKVIFSGLGSEEIFTGYDRHTKAVDANEECVRGLMRVHERDLYRDDVTTMHYGIELRLPFLDRALVDYALKIPVEHKLSAEQNKLVLRRIAEKQGLAHDYAFRKKRAAQYGSRFDRALLKLAKRHGYVKKSDYMHQFTHLARIRLAALVSGGKDSLYAMDIMRRQGYPVACLVTVKSDNPDSYMFHTPNIDIVALQSEALDIPLLEISTTGVKEDELEDLKNGLEKAKKAYGAEGIVAGALYSTYQRKRLEAIAADLGLRVHVPLWHRSQQDVMRELVAGDYEFIFSSIAAEGLDESLLGRPITDKDVDHLVTLNQQLGVNIAGEGGEFESLVLDCPRFKKKIQIEEASVETSGPHAARYTIKKARLKDKL